MTVNDDVGGLAIGTYLCRPRGVELSHVEHALSNTPCRTRPVEHAPSDSVICRRRRTSPLLLHFMLLLVQMAVSTRPHQRQQQQRAEGVQ